MEPSGANRGYAYIRYYTPEVRPLKIMPIIKCFPRMFLAFFMLLIGNAIVHGVSLLLSSILLFKGAEFRTCTAAKISFLYSSGNCVGSVPISTFMCLHVSDLYIPRIGPHISCSRSIVGIYKLFTDTCMWKLGLWPRNYFSWNISFKFSVMVLCSAWNLGVLTN
jgi:hypothetical protein